MLLVVPHRVAAGQRFGLGSGSPWVGMWSYWSGEGEDFEQRDLTSPAAVKWSDTKCSSSSGDALLCTSFFCCLGDVS